MVFGEKGTITQTTYSIGIMLKRIPPIHFRHQEITSTRIIEQMLELNALEELKLFFKYL